MSQNRLNDWKKRFYKYGLSHDYSGYLSKQEQIESYFRVCDLIKYITKKNNQRVFSLLDVGSAFGQFLQYSERQFKNEKIICNYKGVESCLPVFQQSVITYGNELFINNDFLNIEEKYDYVVAISFDFKKIEQEIKKMQSIAVKSFCVQIYTKHDFLFSLSESDQAEIMRPYNAMSIRYTDRSLIWLINNN